MPYELKRDPGGSLFNGPLLSTSSISEKVVLLIQGEASVAVIGLMLRQTKRKL